MDDETDTVTTRAADDAKGNSALCWRMKPSRNTLQPCKSVILTEP
jgi:hypothetical protein